MANFLDYFRDKKDAPSDLWPGSERVEKSPFSKRKLLFGLLFVLLISGSALGAILFSQKDFSTGIPAEQVGNLNSENQATENQEKLPALEKEKMPAEKYQSENFQISHISFGGDVALAMGDSENLPIEIFGVKADPFMNDEDNESRIAISWKSNKMTVSEITYSLSGGGSEEAVKEDDFGFSHNVILPPLEQGSAYVFSIKSFDRWGKSQSFGYFGAYSSAKADSIFELIGRTFGETFGWAINR